VLMMITPWAPSSVVYMAVERGTGCLRGPLCKGLSAGPGWARRALKARVSFPFSTPRTLGFLLNVVIKKMASASFCLVVDLLE
jgi:hypothetical protein